MLKTDVKYLYELFEFYKGGNNLVYFKDRQENRFSYNGYGIKVTFKDGTEQDITDVYTSLSMFDTEIYLV